MKSEDKINKDRNRFIQENKKFIYNIAYKVCKRNLDWSNDEELSIALIAFNNACNTYKKSKGNFFSYTSVIIKNSLIDFFRKSKKTPYLLFNDIDNEIDGDNYIDNKVSLSKYELELENKKRAEEIQLFSKELAKYKLSFNDLVKSSPSHIDTRNNLLNLAMKCSNNEDILKYILDKHLLPVSQITLLTGAKKKYIEKWRRYLLALILILSSNEYPHIKSYLNIKVGEKNG